MPGTGDPKNLERRRTSNGHGPAMVWVDNGTQGFLAQGSTIAIMTREGQELIDVGYTLSHILNMVPADQVRFIHKMIHVEDMLKYLPEE